MGNVVSITNGREIDFIFETPVVKPRTSEEYLALCKKFLQRQDYERVMCCILDDQYYEDSEKYIQDVVDSYFSFPE